MDLKYDNINYYKGKYTAGNQIELQTAEFLILKTIKT